MDTKFWISGVVMSVLAFALGFIVHGLLLAGIAVAYLNRAPGEA
jgi:hypothetical protein